MINHNKFIQEVATESIVTMGVYGALAHKLISDLDSGLITERDANEFILVFQEREGIDLVGYM